MTNLNFNEHRDSTLGRCGRIRFVLGASAVVWVFWLAACTSSAVAATGHNALPAITSADGGPLQEPVAVAVDRATGDVFVGDEATGYVDVYDPAGKYLTRFGDGELTAVGIAVDESTGVVYVANAVEDAVSAFKAGGGGVYALIGEWFGEALASDAFGEVTGVAVDNSKSASAGDVYVLDGEDPELSEGVVDVFKPKPAGPEEGAEGERIRVLSKGKMEEPNGIAIDSGSGKVYVADSEKGTVLEYSPAGLLEGKLTGKGGPEGTFAGKEEEEGNVTALAVDPTSGDLLVAQAERGAVSEFNPAGEWVGWITSTPVAPLAEPHGIAISSDGELYVADPALAKVAVFGPAVIVPNVTTAKASKLTRTTAVLAGSVDGGGQPGHDFFQYGTTKALGSATPAVAFAAGEEKVTATAGELHAGTTYYYRLAAENESGTSYGATRTFETPTAVEGLSSEPVTGLQPTSATLNGTLTPNGVDAHYYFQWGKTASYGNEAPLPPGEDAGSGIGAVAAKAELTGLAPNTTYHYRLVATNSFGTTDGADQAFSTSGPPRITTKSVTGIGHETATLNGEVNPDELETSYHIEYGETTSYGTETPAGGAQLGSGGKPVAVNANLTGLKLGVTYHYRIVATNSAGTSVGPDQPFTTIPPALTTSYSTEVTPTTATLGATIDPLGHDTTYYFQYGTVACAEKPSDCTENPAAPGEDLGAGETPVSKTLSLTELAPDTTYHYRVIATNSLGEATGTEHTLTTPKPTQPMALPDNRAWEMVTPPDKEGAPVEALSREGGVILASEDGDKLTYLVDGSLGEHVEGNRSPEWQQVLANRGSTSWASQDIATPNDKATGLTAGEAPEYQFFNTTLTSALVEPPGAEPFLAPGVSSPTPYLRDNTTGSYEGLARDGNTAPGSLPGTTVQFVDASPDLTHVVVFASAPITGPDSATGLYEWTGGVLTFVTTLPNGVPATKAELGFHGRVLSGAVSSDGSKVIWTNREENTGGGHLFLRDTQNGETLQVDAAQGGQPEPSIGSAQFQGATPDSSIIFFTDKQRLTPDSTAEPKFPEKSDLYECAVVEENRKRSCRLTDLTVDPNEGEHAAVQGFLLGINATGSDVYLVAQGALSTGANTNGALPTAGGDNLYALHLDGSHWTTRLVATLSPSDSPEWEGNRVADTAYLTARTSPSGRYLAFMSSSSPTGYDNIEANPEAKGAPAEEVYLYDAGTQALTCVSCDPSGARPAGVLDRTESGEGVGLLVDRRKVWAEPGHEHWLAGNIPGWTAQSLTSALFQSRYLNDEGRLYFNSPDELVPAAKNHKSNVYEYEPAGIGNCESPTRGCVALLSSGTSTHESAFIEATASGGDVFFVTESQLLPQDSDTAFDIYDARVCSSETPCQTTPAPPPGPCSSTETCRPAPAPVPASTDPSGTATYAGTRNPALPQPKAGVKALTTTKPAAKPLTRKQKLSKALNLCRHRFAHSKHKRNACEVQAHRRYGTNKRAGRTKSTHSAGSRAKRQ